MERNKCLSVFSVGNFAPLFKADKFIVISRQAGINTHILQLFVNEQRNGKIIVLFISAVKLRADIRSAVAGVYYHLSGIAYQRGGNRYGGSHRCYAD